MHYLQEDIKFLSFIWFYTKSIWVFVQSTDMKFMNLLENTLHNQIDINVAINVLKPSNHRDSGKGSFFCCCCYSKI